MKRLTDEDIRQELTELTGWSGYACGLTCGARLRRRSRS